MTPEMLTTLTEQVAELVQTYSNNYPQFQRATYNETQVRVDFVNRFFKLLGWDVDNERGLLTKSILSTLIVKTIISFTHMIGRDVSSR